MRIYVFLCAFGLYFGVIVLNLQLYNPFGLHFYDF